MPDQHDSDYSATQMAAMGTYHGATRLTTIERAGTYDPGSYRIRMRLADGTVFDSSEGRGPTPMIAGQVIPGFSEALLKMQKGGRYKLKIPGRLAYGATPPPGSPLPPNADLEFDVHVLQVAPGAGAAMMQGMPPQP